MTIKYTLRPYFPRSGWVAVIHDGAVEVDHGEHVEIADQFGRGGQAICDAGTGAAKRELDVSGSA